MVGTNIDAQAPAAIHQPEAQPGEGCGQARGEGKGITVVTQATEPCDGNKPRAGERGEVQTVRAIARGIVKVNEGRLTEVTVSKIEVSHLGGYDCLNRRR